MRIVTIILLLVIILSVSVISQSLQFELSKVVKDIKKECFTSGEEKALIVPREKRDLSSVLNFGETLYFHNKQFDEVTINVSFMNNGKLKEHDLIVKLISSISKLLKDIEYTEVDPRRIEFVAEERNIMILQRSSEIQLVVEKDNKVSFKKIISGNDNQFKIAVEIMGILFGHNT